MAKEKIEMIQLSAIVNKFDVRIALDDDRVIQFAGMYESGVELPPVKVVKVDEDTYAYIDGRTRGAARELLNLPDVPAIVYPGTMEGNMLKLFAEALEANWGGSKPPTREDIIHTILRMLELGASNKAIREKLAFLPTGSCSAYIKSATQNLNKRRMYRALAAVSEGSNIEEAAKTFKLDPEAIKDSISGKKRRFGTNRSSEQQMVLETQAYVSKALKSANSGISKKMEFLLKQVDTGDVSPESASKVIEGWAEHLRRTSIRVTDWQSRLYSITASHRRDQS